MEVLYTMADLLEDICRVGLDERTVSLHQPETQDRQDLI